MRTAIFIILSLSSFQSFACVCDNINRSNFEDVLDEADFVFIGTPLKNVSMIESLLEYLDNQGEGTDILVKVNSVIKGNIESDTVFINQAGQGNCLKIFKLGTSYLIIGYEIKGYDLIETPVTMLSDSIPAPPPPLTYKNGIVTDRSFSSEYIDFNNGY